MGHDESSARKNYKLIKRKQDAGVGSDAVRNYYYGSEKNPSTPKKWIPSEEVEIQRAFSSEIANGDVNINTVREKRSILPFGGDITDKQIADKVRSLHNSPSKTIEQINSSPSNDIPDVMANASDESPTKRYKQFRKGNFTLEETKTLLRKCRPLLEKRSFPKAEIKKALNGEALLNTNSLDALRGRLTYLCNTLFK